jgi:hypothetical protein
VLHAPHFFDCVVRYDLFVSTTLVALSIGLTMWKLSHTLNALVVTLNMGEEIVAKGENELSTLLLLGNAFHALAYVRLGIILN